MKKLYTILMAGAAMMATTAFAAEAPEALYLVGDTAAESWNPEKPYTFEAGDSEGVFVLEDVEFSGSYFGLINQMGNWDEINGSQCHYVPADESAKLELGSAFDFVLGEKGTQLSFSIPEGKGTYSFTVDFNKMTVTVEGTPAEEEPGTGIEPDGSTSMYIIGEDVDGENWALGTNQMTFDETKNVYIWEGESLASGFKFNDGTWSHDQYNIGAEDSDVKLSLGEAYTVVAAGSSGNIVFDGFMSVSNPVVVLDLAKMTVTVTGTAEGEIEQPGEGNYPAVLYLIGAPTGWSETEGIEMEMVEPGVFAVEDVEMPDDTSYFAFTSELGSWTVINANRVAPEEKDAEFSTTEGNSFVLGKDASWQIPAGTYSFYVNFNSMKAATTLEAGVKKLNSDNNSEEVIYNLNGVRVSRANMVPGIYVVNGKKVIVK